MSFKDIIREIARIADDLWTRGWIEANGGNISVRLTAEQTAGLDSIASPGQWQPLTRIVPDIGGDILLVTGTGKFLRNIALNTMDNVGFVEINEDGSAYRLLYGFLSGGRPTSELPTHLGTHNLLAGQDGNLQRVVLHCHPVNLIALSNTHDFNSDQFSKLLWQIQTESLVIFPKGIAVLDWMIPGSDELGDETSKRLIERPLAVWKHHGILATGENLDQAFGRIHVAEKAAEIYLKTKSAGGPSRVISNEDLVRLAKFWNCDFNPVILEANTGY